MVSSVLDKEELREGVNEMLSSFNSLLWMVNLIAAVLAVASVASLAVINITDRYTEYGQMRAIGYSNKAVFKMILLETGLLGFAGMLLGFPFSIAGGWWMTDMLRQLPVRLFWFDWTGIAVSGIFVFACSLLASIPAIKIVRDMKLNAVISERQMG